MLCIHELHQLVTGMEKRSFFCRIENIHDKSTSYYIKIYSTEILCKHQCTHSYSCSVFYSEKSANSLHFSTIFICCRFEMILQFFSTKKKRYKYWTRCVFRVVVDFINIWFGRAFIRSFTKVSYQKNQKRWLFVGVDEVKQQFRLVSLLSDNLNHFYQSLRLPQWNSLFLSHTYTHKLCSSLARIVIFTLRVSSILGIICENESLPMLMCIVHDVIHNTLIVYVLFLALWLIKIMFSVSHNRDRWFYQFVG